jgi:alpha-1,2-mannosyltransferase
MNAGATTQTDVVIAEKRRSVAPWVRRGGALILGAALLAHVVSYVHFRAAIGLQIDALVYRFGGMRLRDGLDLYTVGLTGNHRELLFVYSPFAALCFLPAAFIGQLPLQLLSLVSAWVLVTYVVSRMLASLGVTRADGLWSLTALVVALAVWLEPVRLSMQLGQINLAIMAVVVADLLSPRSRKWAGIGVGLVAGVKLTPAIFIIYLAATRRWRAAGVATVTLAATIAVGFMAAPKDSIYYWFKEGFSNSNRISPDPAVNTSVRGLFERLHFSPTAFAAVAFLLVAAALAVAVIAHQHGDVVLAISVVGLASCAASPFSWSHHWVWVIPLMVHLAYRGYVLRRALSAWSLWLLFATLGGWFTGWRTDSPHAGLLSLHLGGEMRAMLPAAYVFVFLTVLSATAGWLWRSGRESDRWIHSAEGRR